MPNTTPPQSISSSPDYDRYKGYLLEGETIESVFDLGFSILKIYRVIATNRRMIILKKFPKNLLEIDYANIELLEYYTNVDWLYSLYAGLTLIITTLFFMNRHAVITQIDNFIPPIGPILDATLLPNISAGEFLLTGIGLCIFLYFFGLFFLSMLGRLRILIYDQPPIDIISSFTGDIQNLIKIFESKKRTSGAAPMQRARYQAFATPVAPPVESKGRK